MIFPNNYVGRHDFGEIFIYIQAKKLFNSKRRKNMKKLNSDNSQALNQLIESLKDKEKDNQIVTTKE